MTYENAWDHFEKALACADRAENPELRHLICGLRELGSALRTDLDALNRHHEKTQQSIARVNAEVSAAQNSLTDVLKGFE